MERSISSAGLVYVYLNGYEENGFLNIQTIDTYRYMEDSFYDQVMEKAAEADQENNMTHVFAVLGTTNRVNTVYRLCEVELRKNFQRILKGEGIQKSVSQLDKTGNAFLKCVQEFFCERPGHFPQPVFLQCGDIAFAGVCCSRLPEGKVDDIVNGIISLWLEREKPCLLGRQVMLRSFLFRDLVGRKVVACFPQMESGLWNFVFEGGRQLSMRSEVSYSMETVSPNELGGFSASNIFQIVTNPVYAYGVYLQPAGLCEDWHKVFLYLCAVSECEWDIESLSKTYERFLDFLQKYICETISAEPIVSKALYHSALLKHIQSYRMFLKGEDEPVISKDLHQTINCRYVYLPYLWELVPHREVKVDFSRSELHSMINVVTQAEKAHQKGVLWEDVAAYVLQCVFGWKITGRRIRAHAQEIDICVVNDSMDDDLWKLGAFILVECKNWRESTNVREVRNIAHISHMKGNKTALLFSVNGVTKDAEREIERLSTSGLSIICITADDLLQIRSAADCRSLILQKWAILQDIACGQICF